MSSRPTSVRPWSTSPGTATRAVSSVSRSRRSPRPWRTLDQARGMSATAAAGDRITMIGLNRRYAPVYAEAMARSRVLGPPTSFYVRFSRDGLGQPPSNTADDWLVADSVHFIDLAV